MLAQIGSFGARRIAVVALAASLVGIVAVPQILATSAPPAPATTAQAVEAADRPARLGRVMRGDATVLRPDGTKLTVHFERGQVTAAGATSLTLKGADGTSTTFAIGPDTRIRSRGQAASVADLKVGDVAIAIGTGSGSTYDALLIRIRVPLGTK